MTRDKIAEALNGREYLDEISPDIQHGLQGTDLVVVFGASDDLMEFRGAINDERGSLAFITPKGLFENECDCDDCPYAERMMAQAKKIDALFCDEPDISWTYKTDIPHAEFTIWEDGEKYCRGIVFSLSDV